RYRKLIHRLGEGRDPMRTYLWGRLAELYLSRLGDRESARVAFEVLAKLAPEDPRPREALAQMGATPAEPPEAQVRAHLATHQWDAAFIAAAVAQGSSGEAADFYRRYRPRFLQRSAPLPQLPRHGEDDADMGRFLARVFAVQPPAFSLVDLGVGDSDRV